MGQSSSSKESVKFSEEELQMIDQGLAEFQQGEGLTPEEAHDLARERTP